MSSEMGFRVMILLGGLGVGAIRGYYQSKVLSERERTQETGRRWRLVPIALAALVNIVFGVAFIVAPRAWAWSYVRYPLWMRALGTVVLGAGVALLWWSHAHLGKSFHSLVVRKEEQVLVESGPYRWVRHPIYTAYLFSYIGTGLVASSWVLTFVSGALFALGAALRIPEEEAVMVAQFGDAYRALMARTGRLLPRLGGGGGTRA